MTVLGGGSWGTALAIALAGRFERVHLWVREPELAAEIRRTRENARYLPGFPLPDNVSLGLEFSDLVIGAVPVQYAAGVYAGLDVPRSVPFVNASKGIEKTSLRRVSAMIASPYAVLSGPTFAREVAQGQPAAMVLACADEALGRQLQQRLATPRLRLYRSTDVTGVELGGALKNVIAIGAGIVDGLGLGSNTLAALITRGLAEMTRIAVAAGAEPRTLSGLAGLGDLVLTATGDASRNRRAGLLLAQGRTRAEVIASTNMVAEGIETTAAALALAEHYGVEAPITSQIAAILDGRTTAVAAIRELMERSLTTE